MDEEVYNALKGIFRGQTGKKKNLAIRKIVDQHSQDDQVKLLLQSHSLKDVCKITQSLLADQIFSSEKKAEARFTKAVVSLPEPSTTTVSSSAAAAAANKQSMILRERANTGKDGNEQCMLEAGENRANSRMTVWLISTARTSLNSFEA